MLVLSRKSGEQICIGDGVVLTVISVHGDRVRLGVQAPPEVSVDRQEIRQRKIDERSVEQRPCHWLVPDVACSAGASAAALNPMIVSHVEA